MFYERKVKYLDHMVKRERCGSAGFVKLEARDTVCNVTISVNNLRTTNFAPLKIYLCGGGQERELCSMELSQGKGMLQLLGQDLQDIGGTGISYEMLEAVRIPISAERELYCVLGRTVDYQAERLQIESNQVESDYTENHHPESNQADNYRAESNPTEKLYTENHQAEIHHAESNSTEKLCTENHQAETHHAESNSTERLYTRNHQAENAPIENRYTESCQPEKYADNETESMKKVSDLALKMGNGKAQVEHRQQNEKDEQPTEEVQQENVERRMPLYDDKWRQLWEIYPRIAPFRDEREYLSVTPGDFVVLPAKYFRMANNSFLLHGYYNYKHLVLKKMEYHGEVRYYIGVPGNFYDREKQVAVMFGFESFESLEEPACTGDYGYYLMRIEL